MERFKKYIEVFCDVMEMVAALLVLLGILFSIFGLVKHLGLFTEMMNDTSAFRHYLEEIFIIVIGIEFLQMLCRPNADHVIEILIFLVARHMIIGDTTPYEDFVSVISVVILCVVRRYLRLMKESYQQRAAGESAGRKYPGSRLFGRHSANGNAGEDSDTSDV